MFKVSVGTLAMLAAPADQHDELPPRPAEAGGGGDSAAAAADSTGGGDDGGGGGDSGGPASAQQRALAGLSASVRPQLELLGDLSRAVGHAEATLVCASLLRDAAGATATLG